MRLKIVLHIKIQFVSSDLMVVNKTHFKRHTRNGHSRLPSATLWSLYTTAGMLKLYLCMSIAVVKGVN